MGDNAHLRNWVFTTYNIEEFEVPETFKHFRYCVYQLEECPTSGREHFQGYLEFTRVVRLNKVKQICCDNTMHLQARKGTREQARMYCMKQESRLEDPKEFGTWVITPGNRVDLATARETILTKRKIDECYTDSSLDSVTTKYPRWVERVHNTKTVDYTVDIQLYPWQTEIYEKLVKAPEHRRIYWIWSTQSTTGKTTFKDWVSLKLDVLPASGKLPDILYAYDNNQVIWFDFTRAQEGYESYQALEELSNIGFKLSTKYQAMRKFVRAHIVVTSNHAPDTQKLPNRFIVYHVDPKPASPPLFDEDDEGLTL